MDLCKMFTHRFKPFFSQSFRNPFISRNPHFSFSYSLPYSSQTLNPLKPQENSNAISEYFVREHQFSSEVATKAASSLSQLKTPEKCDAVLSFFKGFGFSKMDLQNIVTSKSGPTILCANVDKTLKPKIKIFQDFGFSKDDIICIVNANIGLLTASANNQIFPSLSVLKNVLGSVDLVVKLLKVSGWFVRVDLKKTVVPNIEFLTSCGIQFEQLTHNIFNIPGLFLLRPDNLKKVVERVDEIGFNKESKMYIYAIKTISSMSDVTWEKKLELFRSLGFAEDQILQMFHRAPHAFSVSEEKIKEVVQVIDGSSMYNLSDIVRIPTVLTCSVERRLTPRLQVFEILVNRNLIPRRPSLTVGIFSTDVKFIGRFITPYLDKVGDTDLLNRQLGLLKKGHPGNHV